MESYSSREFVLYFLVSLFSCFDHFIGVLVGRSMLSCYHGVHGQPRRAFAFFVVVVDFFLNNNNLQFLTSKIERVLGKKNRSRQTISMVFTFYQSLKEREIAYLTSSIYLLRLSVVFVP